jgi:superfamily II DNA/RNA helicase
LTEQTTFNDLGLSPPLMQALDKLGYKIPTPIQAQAIPYILMGRDVMGIAQTGTGKTAGFTLPMLEILQGGQAKSRMPRALILAPTRELAAQIQDNFKQYGQFTGLTTALLVGGDSMNEQMATLQKSVDVLIATPGRLMDMFSRGALIMTSIKMFVIDEADRMLDMGFIPDIEKIASFLPPLKQTLMFTATMPSEIKRLADKFLKNPKEISVARASSTAQTIAQYLYFAPKGRKYDCLLDLIRELKPASALVFCNRKIDVDKVQRFLKQNRIKAEAMHGDMAQSQRYASLDRFKTGESAIIVCSDIAARGLDIDDVSHVFNFDIPFNAEDYVHRIGRTGRAGKTGSSITLVTAEDERLLDGVQKLIQQKIPLMPKIGKAQAPRPERAPEPQPQKQAEKLPERQVEKQPEKQVERQERPRPPVRDDQNDQDDKTPVRGFGSDTPAFLRGK